MLELNQQTHFGHPLHVPTQKEINLYAFLRVLFPLNSDEPTIQWYIEYFVKELYTPGDYPYFHHIEKIRGFQWHVMAHYLRELMEIYGQELKARLWYIIKIKHSFSFSNWNTKFWCILSGFCGRFYLLRAHFVSLYPSILSISLLLSWTWPTSSPSLQVLENIATCLLYRENQSNDSILKAGCKQVTSSRQAAIRTLRCKTRQMLLLSLHLLWLIYCG